MISMEELTWEFEKLKDDVKLLRKKGKDVKILEIREMQIESKIRYAKVTNAQADIDRALVVLQLAQADTSELADQDETVMLLCTQRIAQIEEALSRKDNYGAHMFYAQIRSYYSKLRLDDKKIIYPQLSRLSIKLQKI